MSPSRHLLLHPIALLACVGLLACQDDGANAAEPAPFATTVLISGLDQPWGMAFMPDDSLLITEKTGRLLHWRDGVLQPITGIPQSHAVGQGGLLDVALHPDFATDPAQRWVYLSYTYSDGAGYGTALGRGQWKGTALADWQLLFELPQTTSRGQHFGSRIVFDRDDYLYLSIGDRGDRDRAQSLADPAGAVLRLHADGRIPADNPFRNRSDAHPAIFSYGHRNPQGMTRHPVSGAIWAQEHGPQGGDELNQLKAAANYGWPTITYGEEYGTGLSIGEGTAKPGIEPPVHYWKPSIAPSGLAFYQGTPFAAWNGDVLVGALKAQRLVRLQMQDGRVISEHRYLPGEAARIRDVRVGPDGLIYLLTDARNGELRRLSPS